MATPEARDLMLSMAYRPVPVRPQIAERLAKNLNDVLASLARQGIHFDMQIVSTEAGGVSHEAIQLRQVEHQVEAA